MGGSYAATVLADVDAARLGVFQPVPEVMASAASPVTAAKIKLGKQLYFDPRLSKNQDVSCNSCHGIDTFGVE